MAVEPPVPCASPKAKLLYLRASAGADSTFICPQSASSSSARMVAMPVYGPCPNSMCLEITVTVLSGAMRMNALGTNSPAGSAASARPRQRHVEADDEAERQPRPAGTGADWC